MPILVPVTLVSGIVVAILTDDQHASFWLAVVGCIAVLGWQIIAVSLYPLNKVILQEDERGAGGRGVVGSAQPLVPASHLRMTLVVSALVTFILSALLS